MRIKNQALHKKCHYKGIFMISIGQSLDNMLLFSLWDNIMTINHMKYQIYEILDNGIRILICILGKEY